MRKNKGKKLAYDVVKGDTLYYEGRRCKVLSVLRVEPDHRMVHITIKDEGAKRILRHAWNENVTTWLPPAKRRRYAFLMWLAKLLGTPIKKA